MRFISDDAESNNPLWMTPEEISDPQALIRQFCRVHSASDCRFFLWQMLSNSISVENPHMNASPGEQIYFFESLIPFIEAVFLREQNLTENPETAGSENEVYEESMGLVDVNQPAHNLHEQALKLKFKKSTLRKRLKHLRKHSVWYRHKIRDPLRVIGEFFDAYSLANFRASFYEVLVSATNDNFYRKGSPGDVLYILEKLESIINAAYLINTENFQVKIEDPYVASGGLSRNWNSAMTPLMLTKEEIGNPTAVLVSFFAYKPLKEWKQELAEINTFALSKHPAYEWEAWIDTLSIFGHSVKLVEALYLIGRCYRVFTCPL